MPKEVSGILADNIRVFSKFFLCACFEVKPSHPPLNTTASESTGELITASLTHTAVS